MPLSYLLTKIHAYGIHGKLFKWIESFLSNRTFRIKIESSFSDEFSIHSGVPQGSVLGPLLFLLYINDLPDNLPLEVSAMLYADDVKLFTENNVTIDNRLLLQDALDKLYRWSEQWALPISIPKCAVIHISKIPPLTDLSYSISSNPLPVQNFIRDLGIIVDNKLQFNQHFASIYKRAFYRANILLRSLKSDNINLFALAFKTYIRPILEYAPEVWSPKFKRDTIRLEKVQRKFTRIAYRKCHLPAAAYEERLCKMSLELLEIRRIKSDLCSLFKMMFGSVHFDFNRYFTLTGRIRGHPCRIFKKRFGNINQNCFHIRVVNAWNALPASIFGSLSVVTFRNKLDKLPSSFYERLMH